MRKKFPQSNHRMGKLCIEYLKQNIPMKPLAATEERVYENARNCYLCRNAFTEDDPRGIK